MSENLNMVSAQDAAKYAAEVAQALTDKLAMNVEVLHVARQTSLADYFIICTGSSNTHMKTLSEEVEHLMETKYGIRPHHIEGYGSASWVLADYGFMVVHIFHKDTRQFYSLERLWADAAGADSAEKDGKKE